MLKYSFSLGAQSLLALALCFPLTMQAQNPLESFYNSANLSLALPPNSRDLGASGNPKVDGSLLTFVAAPTRGLGGSEARLRDGRVSIVASATTAAAVAPLQASITRQGGEVVAVLGRSIFAWLPTAAVTTLGMDPSLALLSLQDTAHVPDPPRGQSPTRGMMTDGVAATKANLLHQRGIKGANVKVGILDFGFTGYQALQTRGVLPVPKAVKAFGQDGGWDRVTKGTKHGTECAEIVHAMAPEADLYIASIGDGSGTASWNEIVPAAQWLASQGVDIISYSGGSHSGAHNGKDAKDKLIEEMTAKGILWVASAGNEGDDHWSTPTAQSNADRLVMTGTKPFVLLGALDKQLTVEAVWDDWGPNPENPTPTQDFDIVVDKVDVRTQKTTYVAHSADTQNGRGRPYERISFTAEEGEVYALFIIADKVTRPVHLHIFSSGAWLFPQNSDGSVGIPAVNPLALAVGAVNVDNAKLEVYSSQGPTDDGRTKPDVSAPDRVRSQATGEDFTGTSAACPFAAGFAALVRQMRGKLPPAQMIQIITAATTPLTDNRGAGRGLIDASKLIAVSPAIAPTPVPSAPAPKPTPAASPALTLQSVLQLAREDNPLGVRIAVGHSEYRVGDGLKVGYRADQDAYCLVIRKNSAGQFSTIQPVTPAELHLAPGTEVVFPAEAARTIRLTGPPGTEQIGIVCSQSKIRADTLARQDPNSLSVAAVSYRVQ